jgi:hypothetical protein
VTPTGPLQRQRRGAGHEIAQFGGAAGANRTRSRRDRQSELARRLSGRGAQQQVETSIKHLRDGPLDAVGEHLGRPPAAGWSTAPPAPGPRRRRRRPRCVATCSRAALRPRHRQHQRRSWPRLGLLIRSFQPCQARAAYPDPGGNLANPSPRPNREHISRTLMLVRSFSATSRPALRAAACGGRPRPATDHTGPGPDPV